MQRFILSLSLLFCFAASASAGLKVYYLRHAQSGANVARDWQDVFWLLRPSYVGDAGAFSPLGETQAAATAGKLAKYQFDFIAVSPTWRTRQTILGFLKKNHRKAEIWPELEEFGFDKPRAHEMLATGLLPVPRPDLFSGPAITIPDEEKDFFILRNNDTNGFHLRSGVEDRIEDGISGLEGAIALIHERRVRGDRSILLVGHAGSGDLLLRMLVKDVGELPSIKNADLWMAEEQADGHYELKMYNDEPVALRHAAK